MARFVRSSGRRCARRDTTHDPGDFCATIWIYNLSPLYLTTLDRAFDDLDGDSWPLVRRPLRRLLFILSLMFFSRFPLIDVVPERP